MFDCPVISGVRAGIACSHSILLIQPSLHDLHTTLAVQSIESVSNCLFSLTLSLENHAVFLPGNRSFIHWLAICSADSFPVWSQNAHSFIFSPFGEKVSV